MAVLYLQCKGRKDISLRFYSEVICMYYSLCYCCLLKYHWWIPRERSSYSNSFAFQQHFSIVYKLSKLNINQLFLHLIFNLSIHCRNRIVTTTLQAETSKANRSTEFFFFITMAFGFLCNEIPVCKFSGKFWYSGKKKGWGVVSKCDSQNNWELWKLFSKWICLQVLMRRELQIQCQLTLLKIRLGVYVYKIVS